MYAPFQHDIHNFNGPSQRLTGASHGGGFVIIAIATVVLAPAMEELFFRGLLLKALVRLLTPLGPGGSTGRVAGVVRPWSSTGSSSAWPTASGSSWPGWPSSGWCWPPCPIAPVAWG